MPDATTGDMMPVMGGAYGSATAMAWELAGCPRRDGLAVTLLPGRCAVCGTRAEQTVPAKATVATSTFTDRDLLADRAGDMTCYPCAWAITGRPPHALRTWTVACAGPGTDLGPSNPKAVPAGPVLGCAVPFSGRLLVTAPDSSPPAARELPPDGAHPGCPAPRRRVRARRDGGIP